MSQAGIVTDKPVLKKTYYFYRQVHCTVILPVTEFIYKKYYSITACLWVSVPACDKKYIDCACMCGNQLTWTHCKCHINTSQAGIVFIFFNIYNNMKQKFLVCKIKEIVNGLFKVIWHCSSVYISTQLAFLMGLPSSMQISHLLDNSWKFFGQKSTLPQHIQPGFILLIG